MASRIIILKTFCLILFLATAGSGIAQIPGFTADMKRSKVEIPFEYSNNFIIVRVKLNQFLSLRFIFDTGAEHTILTKKEVALLLRTQFVRRFKIIGSDMTQELIAYLVTGTTIETGNLMMTNQPILVLDDDYFHFDEFTGTQIHGILGANIFRNFIVSIDYHRRIITLQYPDKFREPKKGFSKIPLEVFKNKPYVHLESTRGNNPSSTLKLLLDTGAGLPLLIHTYTDPKLKLPENVIKGNIGQGLGGFLEGYVGRTDKLAIGPYELRDVLTNYQEFVPDTDTSYLNGRNGILGNQVLKRFDVILNYEDEIMYLQPNKYFDEEFQFDRSGLTLIATGKNLNEYIIHDLVKGSPAAEAGFLPGDRILSVNGWPAWLFSLEGISKCFKKKIGKKMKLKVEREGEKKKMSFRLEKII